MKHYILYILLYYTISIGCSTKRDHIEEGAYNPYDTSEEVEGNEVTGDTIYSKDSVAASIKLYESGAKHSK